MTLPSADTPLYNHTLVDIEQWLSQQGCQQDPSELNRWSVSKPAWQATLILETDSLVVRYLNAGEESQDVQRGFKYSLSRQDLESAIFTGP